MNKERYNQIIDEVYETYKTIHKHDIRTEGDRSQLAIESLEKQLIYPQEEFTNKCKTDTEFSETWGLKIEERELSLEDRMILCKEKWDYSWNRTINLEDIEWRMNNEWNIPTKLITLTYNNETIESHE